MSVLEWQHPTVKNEDYTVNPKLDDLIKATAYNAVVTLAMRGLDVTLNDFRPQVPEPKQPEPEPEPTVWHSIIETPDSQRTVKVFLMNGEKGRGWHGDDGHWWVFDPEYPDDVSSATPGLGDNTVIAWANLPEDEPPF